MRVSVSFPVVTSRDPGSRVGATACSSSVGHPGRHAAVHGQDLSMYEVRPGRAEEEDGAGRLFWRPGTAERDDLRREVAHRLRDPELDLAITAHDGLRILARRRRQARLDEPEGDGVYVDLERPPLARERLRQPDERRLG